MLSDILLIFNEESPQEDTLGLFCSYYYREYSPLVVGLDINRCDVNTDSYS